MQRSTRRKLIVPGLCLLLPLVFMSLWVLNPDKVVSYFELTFSPRFVVASETAGHAGGISLCCPEGNAPFRLSPGARYQVNYYWYEKDCMCLKVSSSQGDGGVIELGDHIMVVGEPWPAPN